MEKKTSDTDRLVLSYNTNLNILLIDSVIISLISSNVQPLGSQSKTKIAVSHLRREWLLFSLKVSFKWREAFVSLQNDWTFLYVLLYVSLLLWYQNTPQCPPDNWYWSMYNDHIQHLRHHNGLWMRYFRFEVRITISKKAHQFIQRWRTFVKGYSKFFSDWPKYRI